MLNVIECKESVRENDAQKLDEKLGGETYPAELLDELFQIALDQGSTDALATLLDHAETLPERCLEGIVDAIQSVEDEQARAMTEALTDFTGSAGLAPLSILELARVAPETSRELIDDLKDNQIVSLARDVDRQTDPAILSDHELVKSLAKRTDHDDTLMRLARSCIREGELEPVSFIVDKVDETNYNHVRLIGGAADNGHYDLAETLMDDIDQLPRTFGAPDQIGDMLEKGYVELAFELSGGGESALKKAIKEYGAGRIDAEQIKTLYDESGLDSGDSLFDRAVLSLDREQLESIEFLFDDPTYEHAGRSRYLPSEDVIEYLNEQDRLETPEDLLVHQFQRRGEVPGGFDSSTVEKAFYQLDFLPVQVFDSLAIDFEQEASVFPDDLNDELASELKDRDAQIGDVIRACAIQRGARGVLEALESEGFGVQDGSIAPFFVAPPDFLLEHYDQFSDEQQEALKNGAGELPVKKALSKDGQAGQSWATELIEHGFDIPEGVRTELGLMDAVQSEDLEQLNELLDMGLAPSADVFYEALLNRSDDIFKAVARAYDPNRSVIVRSINKLVEKSPERLHRIQWIDDETDAQVDWNYVPSRSAEYNVHPAHFALSNNNLRSSRSGPMIRELRMLKQYGVDLEQGLSEMTEDRHVYTYSSRLFDYEDELNELGLDLESVPYTRAIKGFHEEDRAMIAESIPELNKDQIRLLLEKLPREDRLENLQLMIENDAPLHGFIQFMPTRMGTRLLSEDEVETLYEKAFQRDDINRDDFVQFFQVNTVGDELVDRFNFDMETDKAVQKS